MGRATARMQHTLFNVRGEQAMWTGNFKAPLDRPGDVPRGRYYDAIGINYDTRSVLAGRKDCLPAGVPVNDLGWEIYHEGLVLEARRLWEEYQAPIWITESGTCDRDDTFRSRYIYEDPRGLASSGLPVERYYHWTLADNWEWDEGYTARFGLIGNDPRTQSRWMKESGRFYAAVAAAGGVSEAMYDQYVAGQRYRVSSG